MRLSDSSVIPDQICSQAAEAINSHIGSYRELYSLRRIHAFIPYISLTASVAHVVITERQGSMTSDIFPKITQGISVLEEMASSNVFAGRAADALRQMASRSVLKATDLASTGGDWPNCAKSATSFPLSHGIITHHLSMRSVSPFSFYLSQVVATIACNERL
jgi:hypothetical protein